jgi:1-acyl-sn-glycerol-3-phosphate acyltransferase
LREVILSAICRPLIALYTRRRVEGLEHLDGVTSPAVFVANHCSHIDTPVILRALPWSRRRRTAVAAAADYFYTRRLLAQVVSLAFNTVPVERTARLEPDCASVLDRLLGDNWSLVVFAEGTRSRDGTVGPLQSGAAVLAAQHGLPIVPVYITGTHATMPPGRRWMRRGRGRRRQELRVVFGPPISPRPREERREVMDDVRLFFESQGAATTPNKRLAAQQTVAA